MELSRPESKLMTIPLLLLLFVCSFATESCAQNESVTTESTTEAVEDVKLTEKQQIIFAKYQRFSKTLTQLYGYMKETDPARADLLMRVIGKSNEARIDSQMEVLLELLAAETPQFAGIVERQDDLINSLVTLLDVLQSEDERQRLQDEIARIEALIGDINKLVVDQKGVRAGTERGKPTEGLEKDQSKVTEDTEKLANKIDEQDKQREEAAESEKKNSDSEEQKPEESETGEQKPGEPKPGEQKSGESKPGEPMPPPEGETPPGEQKPPGESPMPQETPMPPGENSPSEQSPSEQSPSEQKPSEAKPQEKTEPTAGKEEIESAIEKMQKAIEELKQKNKDKASREQDRAIAELEKAKAKLEEILRQLREEEQKIMLAALEARFRKMLMMQLTIRKASGQIEEIEEDKRLPRHRARSIQLARDEQDIVVEADKALIILREEGTSVAFPEAVMQLREDMRVVSERLNEFKVDELTIAIEDDIIEALEEMVEALRKELEKLEEKKKQEGEPQQGEQPDPALVDLIAELKLLRSLQYRVNRRTKQYGRQIDGEQAADAELLELLDELSIRQARIQRATYDLSTGKNE
ncbi:MAG TPA: hypothetical protein DIW81_05180 [Planctomycetaceae bacterium]|nr:hypothetical protein [Rubinisphaera sp.]HCS50973.1 hypothetical protein [Planctomycetaceae bacterium]|tara:strand:- start:2030 stop:3781 length:1752 start_codon:yes stop_codon:yes gene_type:complete